jgi:hypothetical protein
MEAPGEDGVNNSFGHSGSYGLCQSNLAHEDKHIDKMKKNNVLINLKRSLNLKNQITPIKV